MRPTLLTLLIRLLLLLLLLLLLMWPNPLQLQNMLMVVVAAFTLFILILTLPLEGILTEDRQAHLRTALLAVATAHSQSLSSPTLSFVTFSNVGLAGQGTGGMVLAAVCTAALEGFHQTPLLRILKSTKGVRERLVGLATSKEVVQPLCLD
jgi:hypothetical protein